ncbi:MAG: hypothetical protein KBS73_04360 [Bacteroidales bacterium]|nr:hypothetical protein [Candidatus Cacconaster equifaecalis]
MNDIFASIMLLGAVSTGGDMPFWAYSNQFDLIPRTSGYAAVLNAGQLYDEEKTFQWHWGVSAALRGDSYDKAAFIPDEIYAGIKWKKLALDLGMKHPQQEFLGSSAALGTISTTGGNVVMSGNSRSMPGYRISLHPANVPFTNGHLQIQAAFADYRMTDTRIEGKAFTHNTALYLIGNIGRVSITAGLDHWAMWDGSGIGNYFRMLVGKNAGPDGTKSDQMNVIGNQLGAERIAVSYRGKGWRAEFRHDIPYEDKSGMVFRNFPDGVNTLSFSFDDKDRWISDVVYEFQYTMYQSGPIHDPETDEHGNPRPWEPGLNYVGGDNYFNNGEFRSGWTHYGMTIGNPLFFPAGTHAGTWSRQTTAKGVENNRLKAHHIGISGKLFRKVPYKFLATYSQNYGTYPAPYAGESQWGHPWGTVKETPLSQLSLGFTCEIPLLNGHLQVIPGIYADKGSVLKDAFGATVGLRVSL